MGEDRSTFSFGRDSTLYCLCQDFVSTKGQGHNREEIILFFSHRPVLKKIILHENIWCDYSPSLFHILLEWTWPTWGAVPV